MKYRLLEDGFKPKMCFFTLDCPEYIDFGYDSGKEAGYEKAKKEYEEKLENQRNELLARGFVSNTFEYAPKISTEINSLVGKLEDVSPNYVGVNLNPLYNYDIPKQNNIPTGSKLCGYIEIDGTYHKCSSCEHEKIIRQIIFNNEDYRDKYFNTPASFYDKMPRGMLQEEYFAMKYLGFIKISSFKNTPNDMIVFFYNPLTYKQSDIVYLR